jgi:hypothetical protein
VTSAMRRLVSMLLLLSLGMFLPAEGTPLRLCLLENRILLPGFAACQVRETETEASGKCCKGCTHSEGAGRERSDGKQEPPCCVETGKLPDTTASVFPEKLPPPVFIVLEILEFFSGASEGSVISEKAPAGVPDIRGRGRPAERRAVLGVWRI